ncbi:MAG: sulfotransferase, partial [Rhodobacteraceae bacterium]|nr:sulfotransferase [Paracoccaceae bacterium]
MLPVDRRTITKKYKSAMALQATGKLSAAVTAYQELLKIVPHQPEVHFQLARIAKMRGEIALAADHINAALDQRPKEVELLKLSAEVNADAGHFNAAKAAHEQLVAAHPGDLKYAADLAHFLQLSGDTTGAETQLRRLIKKNPYQSELYRMLMTTLRVKPGDTLIGLMKKAISHPKMSDTGKMHLGFALAKAMEDLGRTDQVFRYLNLANDLQAKAFPYSTAQRDAEIDAILAAQADAPNECPASGAPTPILIAGMPRSGTTLVERILSGHPNVAAGGENPHGVKIIANMFGFGPGMRPLASLRKAELQTLAEAYRKTTAWRADQSKATHVTDKAITNYLLFGYLTAAMPSAKIIVVHRDPRDMALSIFKNHFQGGTHQYSNNLG